MLDGRWRATVERGLEPVGQGLHRVGITADGLTVIGLVFAIGTAFLIADGHLLLGGVRRRSSPVCPTSSTARSRARAAAPARAARSSTRSATASPTPRSSSASRGTSPRPTTPATAGARDGGARAVDAHHLRAGPGRVARLPGARRPHGARRAARAPRRRPRVRHPRARALGDARAHRVHRGAAVREGVAPGHARAAAAARVTTAARAPRSRARAASRSGGRRTARRPSAPGARAPRPVAADRPRITALPVLPKRTPYYAYRAGAEIARLRARAGGRARWHARRRRRSGSRSWPSVAGRWSATCAACTGRVRAAPSCGGR